MSLVTTALADGVLTVTLRRADKGNALDAALVEDLRAAVILADSPEVRLLVLRGEGKALCTGFDVGDIGSQTDATAIVAQDGFDAAVGSIGAEVARVERATALTLARADTRDADLADLVRSAAKPGLASRIAAYAGLRG